MVVNTNHKHRDGGCIQNNFQQPLTLLVREFGLFLARNILKSQRNSGISILKQGGDAECIEVHLLIIFLIRIS